MHPRENCEGSLPRWEFCFRATIQRLSVGVQKKLDAKTSSKRKKTTRIALSCCRSKKQIPNRCFCRCWRWNFRVRRRNNAVRGAGRCCAVVETKHFASPAEPRGGATA